MVPLILVFRMMKITKKMKFKKQVYLLQNCIYSLNFTVYYKSFLLTSVHFLYDAFIFLNIFYIPYRSGCHLPVVLYGCLHNGLENGKSWRREMTQSDSLLLRIWKEHFQIKKKHYCKWFSGSKHHAGTLVLPYHFMACFPYITP